MGVAVPIQLTKTILRYELIILCIVCCKATAFQMKQLSPPPSHHGIICHPEDGGSKLLWNTSTSVPNYILSHHTKL